ncbi:MAG TPA: hypothetical protein VH853_02355 [Polyangia bacterium]|jgi:hypothetical protein|nr:hypothetical protein [Polyangia bacterium]
MVQFVTLALVGVGGCSGDSLKSGDAGADHLVADPAACGCQSDGTTLTISFDCFCAHHDCTQPYPTNCSLGGDEVVTTGCGLVEYSVGTVGGPSRSVFDQSGHLVGVQEGTDTALLTCPTDPSVQGYILRAGEFADTCLGATTCACSADGGACVPTDAGFGPI